jgi:hypothetical protein
MSSMLGRTIVNESSFASLSAADHMGVLTYMPRGSLLIFGHAVALIVNDGQKNRQMECSPITNAKTAGILPTSRDLFSKFVCLEIH